MRPMLMIAVILGGMSGVFTLVLLGGGLFAPSSPGSIIAITAVTPHHASAYIANFAPVLVVSRCIILRVCLYYENRQAG